MLRTRLYYRTPAPPLAGIILLSGFCLTAVRAAGEDNGEKGNEAQIDHYHGTISAYVVEATRQVDRFFADDRILDETDQTQVRVTSAVRFEDGKKLTLRMSLSGRFEMPYLEDRFLGFIETDQRERDIKEGLQEAPDVTDDEKSFFAGLRYTLRETYDTRLSLDGGARWHRGPQPFTRIRARRTFAYDPIDIRLTQNAFWYAHRGFGLQTVLDFEYWLDADHFFRASPSMVWSEESQGVDLRQLFSIYHYRQKDTMVGFVYDIRGHTHPSAQVDKYAATFRWRRRTYRDWLYFEIAPGLLFPREKNYDPIPVLTLKMEVMFGAGI